MGASAEISDGLRVAHHFGAQAGICISWSPREELCPLRARPAPLGSAEVQPRCGQGHGVHPNPKGRWVEALLPGGLSGPLMLGQECGNRPRRPQGISQPLRLAMASW